jgi:hypothetical protein
MLGVENHSTKLKHHGQNILLSKNLEASKKFGDDLLEGTICLNALEDPTVKRLTYD